MSIRSRLIALALAVLVPAALLAAASIAYVYGEEQQAYQRSLLEANRDIDAVFSDIVMPGRYSGVDLADLVRQRYGPLPVLLATGYSEQMEAAKRYPVIAKPYDFAEVAARLRALVGSP